MFFTVLIFVLIIVDWTYYADDDDSRRLLAFESADNIIGLFESRVAEIVIARRYLR
jgi:hypothetical protein